MTQQERILRHLKDHGNITSMDAIYEYGATRLSAQIFALRKKGHDIVTRTESAKNRYGEPTQYARYLYINGPE